MDAESAVGAVAELAAGGRQLIIDQVFKLLREHARSTNQRLTDAARYIIDSPTADFPPWPAGSPPAGRTAGHRLSRSAVDDAALAVGRRRASS